MNNESQREHQIHSKKKKQLKQWPGGHNFAEYSLKKLEESKIEENAQSDDSKDMLPVRRTKHRSKLFFIVADNKPEG